MSIDGSKAATRGESDIGRRRAVALAEGSDEYRSKRRALIRAAAAVFKEKGYEAATLNDVAEVVGADRASLYYYVGGKEELFHEVVKGGVEANLAELERVMKLDEPPEEKLRLITRLLLCSYEEHYPSMYVYIQEDMRKVASEDSDWAREMNRATRRFESVTIKLIQDGIDAGRLRDDIRPEVAVNALIGMINWTHRWFKPGRKVAAAELADSFCEIFLSGMGKRP